MRSRVESGRFQMTSDVRDGGCGLWRQRHGACRNEAIHVVDAESDSFEMERANGAGERVGFIEQARHGVVRRQRAKQGREIVDASLGGLSVFCRHDCEYPRIKSPPGLPVQPAPEVVGGVRGAPETGAGKLAPALIE